MRKILLPLIEDLLPTSREELRDDSDEVVFWWPRETSSVTTIIYIIPRATTLCFKLKLWSENTIMK